MQFSKMEQKKIKNEINHYLCNVWGPLNFLIYLNKKEEENKQQQKAIYIYD